MSLAILALVWLNCGSRPRTRPGRLMADTFAALLGASTEWLSEACSTPRPWASRPSRPCPIGPARLHLMEWTPHATEASSGQTSYYRALRYSSASFEAALLAALPQRTTWTPTSSPGHPRDPWRPAGRGSARPGTAPFCKGTSTPSSGTRRSSAGRQTPGQSR